METVASNPDPADWTSIEQLCDHYLGGRPAPAILQILKPLAEERGEVRDFVRRVVRLMGASQVGARNFSPLAAFGLTMAKGFLPGAWGGKIPPIPAPGRHKILDDYISANPWRRFERGTVMIDLGCGFPPTTAVETAQRFPDWQIIGADPCFDPYLLYDRDQSYACIDDSGHIRYFQLQPGANVKTMEDFLRRRERAPELFAQLLPKLPPDNGEMCSAEADGSRLIRWPLKQWESANLKMIQGGIGSDALPTADLLRCFNVLLYYDTKFHREFQNWANSQLREGGLVLVGANSPNTTETYYSVYRKENGSLIEKELAFSVDIVRPLGLMPWFTLHEDNATALRSARLIRRVRSDAEFCAAYDDRLDQLLNQSGLLTRDANGCLASPAEPMPFDKMSQIMVTLAGQMDREGFTLRAAEALGRQGIRAWRNEVGHVAVDPSGL
jgi:hypothetical protein